MSKIDSAYFIEFAEHGDERGNLVVVEGERDVPFAIQRVFYIYGSDPDIVRGQHANRRSLNRFIHADGIKSCQIVMGWTRLHPGSMWNTMPAHTHDRRMEAYLYLDVPADRLTVAVVNKYLELKARTRL